MVLPLPLSKHLLRTSYPPREMDAALAQRSLTEGSLKLHAMEKEIIRLQTKCSVLERERQTLVKFTDNHRALLSPSNKLTHDVLEEIFYHCLPAAHPTVMSTHEPPLSLGLVCRRWRQIAYSIPKLWTSIHVIATSLLPLSHRDTAWKNAISSWLSRSGALPLSISIHTNKETLSPSMEITGNNQFQPYLDLIAPYAHRWESLRLHLYQVNWVEILSQFRSTDVPLLEHLHIEDYFPENSPLFDNTVHGLDQTSAIVRNHGILQAPLLRSLTLPSFLARDLRMHLRWRCLTSLELKKVDSEFSELYEILAQCQSLIAFAIDFNVVVPGVWTPSRLNTSLILPNLQKLSIIAAPGRDGFVCRILDDLTAPSLVHLSYKRKGSHKWDAAERILAVYLESFLDRLSGPLEELDLWYDPASEKLISDFLRRTPGLKRLSLQGRCFPDEASWYFLPLSSPVPGQWARTVPINDTLLSRFIPFTRDNGGAHSTPHNAIRGKEDDYLEQDPTCLCPKLEVLSLSKVNFSHDLLLDFMRSRSMNRREAGVACLRKVSVHFSSSYPGKPSDRKELDLQLQLTELNKETGLQVFLHYYQPLSEEPPLASAPELAYNGVGFIDNLWCFIPWFS